MTQIRQRETKRDRDRQREKDKYKQIMTRGVLDIGGITDLDKIQNQEIPIKVYDTDKTKRVKEKQRQWYKK